MTHADDWRVFRAAIRKAREIFAQPALDALRGPELSPGEGAQSDEQLEPLWRLTRKAPITPVAPAAWGAMTKLW